MAKVVIIGGGFAGLAAAREVARVGSRLDCTLVDRKPTLDFLPMLPDLLSRRLDPELLQHDLAALGEQIGFRFLQSEATGIDLAAKTVATSTGPLPYDHLIVATGSETNFYDRDDLRERALTLDSVADAARIVEALDRGDFDTALVVGGGYTGIETATSLSKALAHRPGKRVMIVELAPALVGTLDPWASAYVARNVRAMGIEVVSGATVKDLRGRDAVLTNGRVVPNALVVWAAGVRAGDVVRRLDAARGKQDRLVVDEFLRLNETCFVAGDAACVMHGGAPMRMAVQISLDEGRTAGANTAALVSGKPLRRYRPLDLGWVVPMRNDRSCGKALGFPVRGFAATGLHYLMCIFRSPGLVRKARMLAQVAARR